MDGVLACRGAHPLEPRPNTCEIVCAWTFGRPNGLAGGPAYKFLRSHSALGEVVPCNEFYDYNAKYVDENSDLLVPAPIDRSTMAEIHRSSFPLGCVTSLSQFPIPIPMTVAETVVNPNQPFAAEIRSVRNNVRECGLRILSNCLRRLEGGAAIGRSTQ